MRDTVCLASGNKVYVTSSLSDGRARGRRWRDSIAVQLGHVNPPLLEGQVIVVAPVDPSAERTEGDEVALPLEV